MLDQHLHFNYKDIFLAPRLALRPKKIWIFTLGNLAGYIFYWVFSFIALITDLISQEGTEIIIATGLSQKPFEKLQFYSYMDNMHIK